ncbi:MAG: hypothetical protein J6Y98_05360 [Bacteroidales bacterium]|nr:hypothetical protein [Bacteroidales bacterium]
MKAIKNLAIIVMLAACTMASAQIKIPETKVSFAFPNGGWKYLETSKINDNTNVYLYSYSKDYVVDNAGDTVIPFMRIYVRKNYTGTVFDMAYSRFMVQGFQALQEYPFLDGLGYLGAYTNDGDGKDYEFRMVYIKDRNIMLEIRLETTLDRFDDFDKEFQSILESIKVTK